MSSSNNSGKVGFDAKIERPAKFISNVKILGTAAISVVALIFSLGSYYNRAQTSISDYLSRIDSLEKKQVSLQNDINNLKSSLNQAFSDASKVTNSGDPFRNWEPKNNGGGNSANQPPGRCQIGQVVVGIGPYKSSDGVRAIDIQCGTIPIPKIP